MAAIDAWIGDEEALRPEPKPDAFGDSGKPCRQCRPQRAVEDPDLAKRLPTQQNAVSLSMFTAQPDLRAVVLEIDRFGDSFGSAARSCSALLDGGARKVTCRPGDTAAMAWMKGRCQMTSPMPRFTWMTATFAIPGTVPCLPAFEDTLIATPKTMIWAL